MLLTEIDHIAIAVRDLDAAIDYYRRALGAEVNHREIVESDGGQIAETFSQPGNVLATAQGFDGKPRQQHEKANGQEQTVEEIHRLEFKL